MNHTKKNMKSRKKIDLVLPIILLTYFMLILDNSIVFTGTVKIAQDLGLSLAELSWVTNAYSLSFGGLLLCGGRLGDIFGRKRIFVISLGIFGIGSLFVGLAQGAISIVIARGLQGIGSAILAPTTLALLMNTYSGEARVRAISAYSATAGLGASIGLIAGGIVTGVFSWRDGFFINVPISVILAALALRYIKEQTKQSRAKNDYLGALSSVIGMVSLVYSIVGESYTQVSLLIAVVTLSFFIFWEMRYKHPMLPLRLFTNRERLGAYLARFFYMASMLSFWFLTPQMLQRVLNFTPLESGLAFFPFTIPVFLFSMKVPKWTKRYGGRRLLLLGILLTLAGFAYLPYFNPSHGYWLGLAIPFMVMGMGQGLCFSPLTSAGVANVLPEDAGAASGTVNVMHQLGGSIGLSVVVALTHTIPNAVSAYHAEMVIDIFYLIAALLISYFLVCPALKNQEA